MLLSLLGMILATGELARFAAASSLNQVQLKGLKRTNLLVFVDRDLDAHRRLEREISGRAAALLAKEGISTQGSDTTTLSIEVKTYPSGASMSDAILVGISVHLVERVSLVRDPSLKAPDGISATTWSKESIDVEAKESLESAIMTAIDLHVGALAADVKTAKK